MFGCQGQRAREISALVRTVSALEERERLDLVRAGSAPCDDDPATSPERDTRLELATSSLGSSRSTN